MVSRKTWNTGKLIIAFLLFFILVAIFYYTPNLICGPSKDKTRITQNIIIHPYEPTNYTITTSLLYFDGENWKDLSIWERDVPISKISATKTYLQSEAEKRQKLVEAALKEFYD